MNYIALSFDIEEWYHVAISLSLLEEKSLEEFLADNEAASYDTITEATLRLLEILDYFDIRATFFIVADVATRFPHITDALKRSNHEIASHSYTHTPAFESTRKIANQPLSNWVEEQKMAKRTLEDIFETEVIGFRAPSAYFANWMVPELEKLGYKYDSSIAYNSFYNKTNVKLKNIPSKPYRLNSETLSNINPDSELYELPWSYYKITKNLILPAGGAFFFRLFGYSFFKKVIDQSLKKGDTMFYLHPSDITEKKISSRPLYRINKGKKTEKKFIKLLKKYKHLYKPCCEIYYKNLDGN